MKKIIIIVGIVLVFGVLFISPLLIKVKIDCKSQYGDCPGVIQEKLNTFNGRNLLSAKRGIRKILGSEFLITDYSLQYKIPNILRVELLVKKAVVAFKDNMSGSFVLVDKEGKVLSVAEDTVLPTIAVDGGLPNAGQNISSTYLFALKIATGINQMYQVSASSIVDGSLHVELPGQIRVIFPLDGDNETLLGSLRLIYSKLREDGNLAGYSQIDLRYKNPVLR